ncbi:MAG: hypothetical protein KY468_08665 [Armatimonadetes bacterium]|nr:hypothetical protein [Armatimonadota bacterium]
MEDIAGIFLSLIVEFVYPSIRLLLEILFRVPHFVWELLELLLHGIGEGFPGKHRSLMDREDERPLSPSPVPYPSRASWSTKTE